MKVIFIYPDLIGSASYGGIFYTGLASLSSVLKEAGHQTALIHITQPVSKQELLDRLESAGGDIYAFSSTTQMFGFVKEWSGWIKENHKDKLVVAGGVHPTLYPRETIKVASIDLCCVGEGESALLDLCAVLEKGGDYSLIPNLWGKRQGKVFHNRPRPLVQNLDRLPFPDRQIFNYPSLMEGREGMAFFMASRGCPYNCPYCCNHSLRSVYEDNKQWVRFRSAENVVQEITCVLEQYPAVKHIAFYDDILALREDWFKQFTEFYRTRIGLPFRCNMRANILAREQTVRMLKQAGCRRVIIGLESGNPHIRNQVLKRNMSEATLLKAGELCRKYGIELATYNMVGVPGEDFAAILDTVKLNARMKTDFNYASIYYPYPKTDLHELCRQKGLMISQAVTDYVEGSALSFGRIAREQILFVRNYFRTLANIYRLIYCLPKKLGGCSQKLFERSLSSRIAARGVFSFANWTFKKARENKLLAVLVSGIKARASKQKIYNIKHTPK